MNRIPTTPKPRDKTPTTVPIAGVEYAYPKVIPKIALRNTIKKPKLIKIIDAINLSTLTIVLNLFCNIFFNILFTIEFHKMLIHLI